MAEKNYPFIQEETFTNKQGKSFPVISIKFGEPIPYTYKGKERLNPNCFTFGLKNAREIVRFYTQIRDFVDKHDSELVSETSTNEEDLF